MTADLFAGPPPLLVASDLDGTLLRVDNTASPRSRAALDRVVGAGAMLVLVTGRPARWMAGVAQATGHHGVALVSNGAGVYDLAAEELISTTLIPVETLHEMAVLLRDRVPDATFAAERVGGYVRQPDYRTPYADVETTLIRPWAEVIGEPVMKLLVRAPSFDADGLLAAGREVVGEHLGTLTHSSREGLLEISAAGVTKASALATLAVQHGIRAEDAVAFGDMPNDIPMLTWAGRSWAVGDAHPLAKAAASAVTDTLENDGVAVVLERLFG